MNHGKIGNGGEDTQRWSGRVLSKRRGEQARRRPNGRRPTDVGTDGTAIGVQEETPTLYGGKMPTKQACVRALPKAPLAERAQAPGQEAGTRCPQRHHGGQV